MAKASRTLPRKKVVRRKKAGATKSILNRIAPVSFGDKFIKINVYGRTGTGKTVLACTFPKKAIILGLQDGTKSVYNVKGVDFVPIKTSEELSEMVAAIPDLGYQTTILDCAGDMQDMILKEILGLEEIPVQRSWGMAEQRDWGQVALQTKERLRTILALPCNVVIIAQERDFNADNEHDMIMPFVASALTPSVVGWLNPACDYIVQTFIREQVKSRVIKVGKKSITKSTPTGKMEYCIRTAPDPTFTTKFRMPKGSNKPDCIVDPDYNKIMKVITQG